MDDESEARITRRALILKAAAGVVGLAGMGFAAVPFVRSMEPSKDILAAGRITVDISGLKSGGFRTVIWRKQPVFILRRTPEMIKATGQMDPGTLADPASPEQRAANPELFVAIGTCTHLGCVPHFVANVEGFNQQGFYCPCHGGKYDSLGRRLAGPPPENLHLVPYRQKGNDLDIGTTEFIGYGAGVRVISGLPGAGAEEGR
ncbi:MAG: ubiquinol-cytochrome c reductase iron-sulfur subunit [Deltaproteobacteria bacterium]|nr:ubiquinol-cytochrome c reductase iron-sulfur subunit [Deltaproteobacteria bacterium]